MNELSIPLVLVVLIVFATLIDDCSKRWTYSECIGRCSVSECKDLRPW